MRTVGRLLVASVVVPLSLVTFCGCSEDQSDADLARASVIDAKTSPNATLVEQGRDAYDVYCVGCHGSNGDGNGAAARFLSPRPRDFRTATFKFSSVRSGGLPRDEDLRRTIVNGLKGTAMPGWDTIPMPTVNAMIAYIKTFSPKWNENRPGTAIEIVEDPYRSIDGKSAAIERGRAVYHGFATCWTCHPSYVSESEINAYLVAMDMPTNAGFRPNLTQSEPKVNEAGEVNHPPDFRRDFVRAGGSVDDLYRSISAGISGTAMPTWIDSIASHRSSDPSQVVTSASDLWAIAYYVRSLILKRTARLEPATLVIRERQQRIYAKDEAFVPVPVIAPVTTGEEFGEDE